MLYSDHYLFAKYAVDAFGIRKTTDRISFILGNVTPDLNKFTYMQGYGALLNRLTGLKVKLSLNDRRRLLIAGHTAEGSIYFVNRENRRLVQKRKWNFRDWYRFGKVVHYVADRFTYPHTLRYGDGFFRHVAYEEQLHTAFQGMLRLIILTEKRLPAYRKCRSLIRKHFRPFSLEDIYRAYRDEKISLENDCLYILAGSVRYMEDMLEKKMRRN